VIGEQDLVYVHGEAESLPDGWKVTTLEGLISDNGQFCDGDWVESKDQDPNGDVRLIQLADIGVAAYRDRSDRYLTSERASALSCTFLQRGDILVARMPDPLGRACLFPGDKKRAVTVVDVAVIRPNNPEVDCRWLMHRINSMEFRNAVASLQSGSTRLRISRRNLSRIAFPLPPLAVQLAEVDELEKQFSRLDEAVANLRRVKANLKRYKASVLKDAVEGRLVPTEAELARREGRTFETGEQLLQRILEERRAKWSGKGKYKEPIDPDTSDLPNLPEGWTWARLDSLAALKGGITVDSKRVDPSAQPVPYLRVANVQRGYIDLAEVKHINASAADIAELRLEHGDVLFNEGGDRDKLGRGWIWEGQLSDCIHQNHVFRARMFLPEMAPKLVSWWGNTFGKDYFQRMGKQTTNLASINMGKLSGFPVPIPPAAEQRRMVEEIERLLSVVDRVAVEVDANLRRAEALRQSCLGSAFSPAKTEGIPL